MRVNTNNHFTFSQRTDYLHTPGIQNTRPPETMAPKHANDCCIWIFSSSYRKTYKIIDFKVLQNSPNIYFKCVKMFDTNLRHIRTNHYTASEMLLYGSLIAVSS